MTGEIAPDALRPPRGATLYELQQWGFQLVNQLRRILNDRLTNDESVAEAIETIETELASIESLTPQQEFELALITAVDTQLGSLSNAIAQVKQWSDNAAESAIHSQINDYNNDAAIKVEQSVRAEQDAVLATQIATLTASLGQTSAAVSTLQNARVDGDTALAQQITAVQTTVAGHTSDITQVQQSVDGISAEWGVAINSQNQVVGLVRLDANQQETNFTVVANKFTVANPNNGEITPVFTIATVDGVTKAALRGDMLVDGSIFARAIAANTITGNEIAANTITANNLSVTTLDALSADIGTITAGKLQREDGSMVIDLDNKTITISTS